MEVSVVSTIEASVFVFIDEGFMPCSDQVSDERIYTQAAVFLSMPVAIYIHSKTRIRHVELPPSEVTLLFIVF